jgi:uncharacterized protein (DUF2267 family)
MPMPYEYHHAGDDFEAFLADVMEFTGLTTRNQAYTTTEAVLRAFRRRVSVRDALAFAQVLPPVLRALFIADWDVDSPVAPFAPLEEMTREVKALRQDHNFSPDTAIADVARALRRQVGTTKLDEALAALPEGAVGFWRGEQSR